MQNLFPVVVLGVVVLSVLTMLVVLLLSDGGATGRSAYDQIGQGGFSRDSDASERASAPVGIHSPSERTEQEREIRQMLSARSERLVRSGKPALDIDAELARLLQPQQRSHDAGLIEEVRQLVTARNERRTRKGMQELDVDQEIQRTLQELDP
jgi:hypothetical protein